MATLNEVMKETADAIREKTGKSEKIAPVNFAEEIKSISAGGGESNIEYLDVRESDDKKTLIRYSLCAKMQDGEEIVIVPVALVIGYEDAIVAVAVLPDVKMADISNPLGEMVTVRELFGESLDSIPRITKEQFYNLDA